MKFSAEYWRPDGLARHTLREPPGLIRVQRVLDVGAGIRPMEWYRPAEHICVEPYPPYAAKLKLAGYKVIEATALATLPEAKTDSIYLLDVIEHMDKDEGWEVIRLAIVAARVQVVVYTPEGFMEQDEDHWEMGGDVWQKHRSGWVPEDFGGWKTISDGRGFLAICTHN